MWAKENKRPGRVHRPAVGHLPRPAGRGAGADGEGSARRPSRRGRRTSRSRRRGGRSRSGRCTTGSPSGAGEADYDTYWERRFEHNLSPDSYRDAAYALGQRPARRAGPAGVAGREPRPRGVHAPPHPRGAGRRGEAGAGGRRGRGVPRAGARPRVPGDDRRRAGVAAPAVEQADADAVLVLQAVEPVGVRGRQPRPGVLRAGLGAAERRRAGRPAAPLPVGGGPAPARGRHAPLDGRGDRGRPAGPHARRHARRGRPDARRPAGRGGHPRRPRRAVDRRRGAGPRQRRHRHRRAAEGRQPHVDPGGLRPADGPAQAGEVQEDGRRGTDARPAGEPARQDGRRGVPRPEPLDVLPPAAGARGRVRQAAAGPARSRRRGRRGGSSSGAPRARSRWSRRCCSARRSSWRRRSSSSSCSTRRPGIDAGRRRGEGRLPVRAGEVDGPGPQAAPGTGRRQLRPEGHRPRRGPAQPGGAVSATCGSSTRRRCCR